MFENSSNIPKRQRLSEFVHFAAHALKEAKEQSGFNVEENPYRVGITLGAGLGGVDAQIKNITDYNARGIRGISPFYIPSTIGNMASGYLSVSSLIYIIPVQYVM